MSKKYFIPLALLVVVILAGAGCATKQSLKTKDSNFANGNQNRGRENFSSSTEFMAGRVKGTLADLKEGSKIMVMGLSNQDGTVSASQIVIGDFAHFASSTRPRFATSTAGNGVGQRQGGQMQGRPGAEGNFGGDQRQGGGQGANLQQGKTRMTGQARLIGEILKKDTIGLVVKITDGGSKIVLYSDKTEVFTLASSTQSNLPPNVTTSTK